MVRRVGKRRSGHAFAMVFIAVATVAVIAVGFTAITLQPAVASHDVDASTLGIGEARSTVSDEEAFAAPSGNDAGTITDANSLTKTASRTISVSDPDPVIVLSAYDALNQSTAAAALALGTTNPLPTAPRILPDESDGWSYGMASSYSFADNDDGLGNFGTDATASGRPLASNEITVAVPESQANLLGSAVAIRYGETIVVATVTDTGGFEKYGRVLDLAPGCWKALGAAEITDWGVKPVYYKFL